MLSSWWTWLGAQSVPVEFSGQAEAKHDLPFQLRRIFALEHCICSLHGEAQIWWCPASWSLNPSKAPLAFVCLTMDCCFWQVSVVRFWNLFWLLFLIQDAITYPLRDRCMFKCKLIWTQHRNYRHNWSEVYITWKLKSWKISAFFLSFLFYFIFLILVFLLVGG